MRQKPNKLYGVGVNDSETPVVRHSPSMGNAKDRKIIWVCPMYKSWSNMLIRCFSRGYKQNHPTYKDVSVCAEWLIFSNFRDWMLGQPWHDGYLDKDLLIPGNKIYSPRTCVFVSRSLNNFITERGRNRGDYKIGVSWHKGAGKFRAACSNPFTLKIDWLGLYGSEDDAHEAWLSKKLEHAMLLAEKVDDPRLAFAIVSRYENYNSRDLKEIDQ